MAIKRKVKVSCNKTKAPTVPRCPIKTCNKIVKDNEKAIQCDQCDRWIHQICAHMSTEQYENLSKSPEQWFCSLCTKTCDLCSKNIPLIDSFLKCEKCCITIHSECATGKSDVTSKTSSSLFSWQCYKCNNKMCPQIIQ